MTTTHLSQKCPHCGYVMDRVTSAFEDATPSPDDLSICIKCGEWCVYTPDMALRIPSDTEYDEIADSAECRAVSQAWHTLNKERRTDQ